jgi:hypothetical protein
LAFLASASLAASAAFFLPYFGRGLLLFSRHGCGLGRAAAGVAAVVTAGGAGLVAHLKGTAAGTVVAGGAGLVSTLTVRQGGGRGGLGRCSSHALEGGAIDGQAFGRELGGIAFTHALDALDEVSPVLERSLLAFVHDLARNAGADALDGVQFGLGGLVHVHGSKGRNGKQRHQHGNDLLEHVFSSGCC